MTFLCLFSTYECSLRGKILTILLRQHSKLLQELLDKQQNMTHDAVAWSLAQKGYCLVPEVCLKRGRNHGSWTQMVNSYHFKNSSSSFSFVNSNYVEMCMKL
ncbi:hypothetical protein R6Q59_007020 [Mikania micrantha]